MRVLMPLPRADFDPSEAAVSWQILTAAGHAVVFATPDGAPATADPIMVSGIGLDFWSRIPGLRALKFAGLLLRAAANARAAHAQLVAAPAYREPLPHCEARCTDFDALLLPGGHAPGMRPYLESATLQTLVAEFFAADKP